MRLKSSDDDGFSSHEPAGEHAHVGLGRKRGQRGGVDVGRDHDFDELALDDVFRGGLVERAVERDDAAERGHRIAGVGALVGLAEIGAERDAARIGMLDDDACRRLAERLDAFERGIGIGDVVERQLLAGQYARGGDGARRHFVFDVQRAALVRILAVAQRLLELEREMQRRRERLDALAVRPARRASSRSRRRSARYAHTPWPRACGAAPASCRRARAPRGSRRSRSDRRRRRRVRDSWPQRAASPVRRCRCSRSHRRACSPGRAIADSNG